ncbi:FG-GAP-like repeat-containing protein [Mucilaginibacter calamicampi]|uniref:FG-GAP-like repeat-containing protein n=1 Tax=Mucilaginibacter calamicampi TaxID=1302352 RepID=A0ABW2YXW2_9SPHI
MKRILSTLLLAGLTAISFGQAITGDYNGRGMSLIPDYVYKGSALSGWHTLGSADWKANNGTITAKANGAASYLISDRGFQDIHLRTLYKANANAEVGFVFRMEKTNDGFKGFLASIKGTELGFYKVTLDAQGKETKREDLHPAGGIIRQAPAFDPNARTPERGSGSSPRGVTGPATEHLPFTRPTPAPIPGQWNQYDLIVDLNIVRGYINDGAENTFSTESDMGFGPIALMVNGTGEVQFNELSYVDAGIKKMPKEQTGAGFKVQRIQDMYYSWAAGSGDFNHDGVTDIVAGPYIYFGPDYTSSREIAYATSGAPSTKFTEFNCQYGYDFNGDGWDDVLSGGSLFVNPKGESRRWDRYQVVRGIQTEIMTFRDVDGDGKPELVYGSGGQVSYAKPDPADITKPWIQRPISEKGASNAHGIGVGDINGDGLMDILNVNGWWEHPKNDDGKMLWAYHPVAFGRIAHRGNNYGGAVMGVYDVNGDKLNDVVTSLNAHGFGLGWFEQKRDAKGNITFVRHIISDDYGTMDKNAGGVAFSEAHATAFADMDGDGIPDFITGKRYWSHLDTYLDPDAYGPPVIYWYKTVRNAKVPGGAEFVPHLMHNRSGVGSDVLAVDLNKDGAVDIVTGTDRGVFIYWNEMKGKAKAKAVAKKK